MCACVCVCVCVCVCMWVRIEEWSLGTRFVHTYTCMDFSAFPLDTTDGAEPSVAKKPKAAGPPPPGGPVEIVFSFDTTGSMYPCLTQVLHVYLSDSDTVCTPV